MNTTASSPHSLPAQASSSVVRQLSPEAVWSHFGDLTAIPRPSGHEELVREHLRQIADRHGFEYRTDATGNVVIAVPGRGRGADAEPVVLQAHMDMVCVKNEGVAHDFMRDPIRLRVEDREVSGVLQPVLTGTGTTLGADNGIGLALALAVATSKDIVDCPPIEVLATVDEERGLTGAKELDPTIVKGRRLVNLDTEEEGAIYISCAGGRDIVAEFPLARSAPPSDFIPVRVKVSDLPGGHSGAEIHEQRGNAIVMVASLLRLQGDDIQLASLEGGSRRNVIPSTCEAVAWVPRDRAAEIVALIEGDPTHAILARGVAPQHHGFKVTAEIADPRTTPDPISAERTDDILDTIWKLPAGVLGWSDVTPGLVESSNNIAVVATSADALRVDCMTRSSKDGEIVRIQDLMAAELEAEGATVTYEHASPNWEADPNNPLLALARKSLHAALGHEPKVLAIHAGLECGAFRQHIPDIKMISFGPDIRDAHTTRECVAIGSVERTWNALRSFLADLCA